MGKSTPNLRSGTSVTPANGGRRGTFAMDVCSDQQTDASDTVERDLKGGAVAPVANFSHMPTMSFELRVT